MPADEGGKLDFKVDLGDPPPCSTGFIPPPLIRSPADTTLRDLPTDLYCKTAQNDPSVVRGARNYPCQEFPGKRAPTIQLCRDPRGYVPIGSNPWRGPPVPYGSADQRSAGTSCRRTSSRSSRRRRIYDPGPPVVQLPPGVAPGPGPAPNAPFPLPVPPNEPGPPPPPWPFYAPPDQIVPPYGRTPPGAPPAGDRPAACRGSRPRQAPLLPAGGAASAGGSGPADGHVRFDRTACSSTPPGERASSPAALTQLAPAENWVDLMLDPRQA